MSIHGTYGEHRCQNKDCGEMFTKKAPQQLCCSVECRNHRTYLRTVVPKRQKLSGKRK